MTRRSNCTGAIGRSPLIPEVEHNKSHLPRPWVSGNVRQSCFAHRGSPVSNCLTQDDLMEGRYRRCQHFMLLGLHGLSSELWPFFLIFQLYTYREQLTILNKWVGRVSPGYFGLSKCPSETDFCLNSAVSRTTYPWSWTVIAVTTLPWPGLRLNSGNETYVSLPRSPNIRCRPSRRCI